MKNLYDKDTLLELLANYIDNNDRELQDWKETCEENGWDECDFEQNHIYAIAQRALSVFMEEEIEHEEKILYPKKEMSTNLKNELLSAASRGNQKLVKLLLIQLRDELNSAPIPEENVGGHYETVRLLLNESKYQEILDETLVEAIKGEHTALVKFLINKDAKIRWSTNKME